MKKRFTMLTLSCLAFVATSLSGRIAAQRVPSHSVSVPTGTIETVKCRGASLEGNLEGDSADRDVSVYLPPSYRVEAQYINAEGHVIARHRSATTPAIEMSRSRIE